MRIDLLRSYPHFIERVASWYFHEWGDVPGNSLEATVERITAKVRSAGPPLHVIAHESGELLGVAQWKRHEMDEFPSFENWLGSVFVSPQHRGTGIGAQLCLAVADIAKARGVAKLYLQTEALDGGLYADLGWEALDQIVSRGDEVLVMVKHL
jgi:GNAT superfamily N-acetyltransferase